jgi:cell fate (sporulation/competence/biofilm development) regulator YlbF (YheA/YmcA/DUF963 family)
MNSQPSASDFSPTLPVAPPQAAAVAARTLGEMLSQTPEYRAFLQALKAVNTDLEVQRLASQIRGYHTALQWGQGDGQENQAELARLEAQLEALATVRSYRQAEKDLVRLFREIDEIISRAAGVPFAPNASRSTCGCGG